MPTQPLNQNSKFTLPIIFLFTVMVLSGCATKKKENVKIYDHYILLINYEGER